MTGPAKTVSFGVVLIFAAALGSTAAPPPPTNGQQTFRYDTFDDEQLWTNVLRMHEALRTVDPATALAVGLKVDVEALPPELIAALRADDVDLTDPAVTIELLRLNAVVGVMGKVDDRGQLTSVGITCALCHSTVDNSFTTGIGKRLDGWPNRDLNVGAILGLSPLLDDPGWGPGRYDPRHQVLCVSGEKAVASRSGGVSRPCGSEGARSTRSFTSRPPSNTNCGRQEYHRSERRHLNGAEPVG